MVRLIYIIGLVLLVFSCNSKRNKIFELSKDELVKGIAEESIIAGSAVGIGGIESDQWRRFLALRAKTNEQDLIDLTNHSNNAVKSYAFMALAETKSEAIFPVLLKNISDTGKVQTFYGCLRGSLTVAEFYIQEAVSGEHLNQIQKRILDSIILFRGDRNLISYLDILETVPPTPTYYNLIKERVAQHPEYVIALARYRSTTDRTIISDLLKNPDRSTQYWGIRAIVYYPDKSFFHQLSILANANYNTPVESEEKYLAALYEALVQYKNHPSKDILKETIHQSTGMDSIKKIDLVYGVLKKYPDSIYRNVIQYF